jgi:methionyl-tRNA formyltransferase
MKTICLAGKHDIAVNILLYCLEHYEKKYIKCILNRNETGRNSWQKSLKWFAEKKDVEIIELEDAYNIKDMIFLSLEFDQIIIPERFQTTELYNIHFSLLPKYKGWSYVKI